MTLLINIYLCIWNGYLRLLHVGMFLEELLQLSREDLVSNSDDYFIDSTHDLPVSVLLQNEQVPVATKDWSLTNTVTKAFL